VDDAAVTASFSVTDSGQQIIAGTLTELDDTFTFVPANLPLPDDTYQVSLTAADVHSNTQNYAFDFTIDTQPPGKPVITGGVVDSGTISPRPAQNATGQFIVELTGTRESGTSVWVNGSESVPFGDASWIVQLHLTAGLNNTEVWLVDKAGNMGASEWVDIETQSGASTLFKYDSSGRIRNVISN
jgi:hypothetical protein